MAGTIRVIAICLFQRNGLLLVAEGWDPVKQQLFYRPLGGGIEFGERGSEALAREIREELGAEVEALRYLGTLENLFVYDGRPGHEIVLVFDGAFCNATLYEQPLLEGQEDSGTPFRAVWRALNDFGPTQPPLYPDGLLELLR